jgi:nucleoside-diphosphate-sugar epimerase
MKMTSLSMEGSRALVVGGAGFVGSALVSRLLNLGASRVHIVDNLLSAERSSVPFDPRIEFTQSSITSDPLLASLRDEYDFVFHLATYHGNQSSIHDPLADHENNMLTTLKLFERLRAFTAIKKIVYSAAGCSVAEKTFGTASATEETDLISIQNNDSPYSISKIFGEFYSVYYKKHHGLPIVRARFQNVYGPGEILGAGRWRGTPATVWRNVTPTFIYKSLKGEELPLENEGAATRDFIFVDEVASGLIACALKGAAGAVYNIASGRETAIAELARLINELTGNNAPVRFLPKRSWDNSGKRFGSPAKAQRELGFRAVVLIEQGLRITIEWTRANLPKIEEAISKHNSKLAELRNE